MVLFFFSITDAHLWGSIRKKAKTLIPYWQVFLFKFQLFIVYFYGAIAKVESDWFQGFPMRYWLHMVSEKFSNPTLVHLLKQENTAYFICYTGFIFDLLVGFMLFSKRFQRLALLFIFSFHFSNHFLWDIGTFPFVMFFASSIFFAPDWPQKAWEYFEQKPKSVFYAFISGVVLMSGGLYFYNLPVTLVGLLPFVYFLLHCFHFSFFKWLLVPYLSKEENEDKTTSYLPLQKAALTFMILWMSTQILLPFRHWILKGHPSWCGEGHLFAWRMMLVANTDAVKYHLVDNASGEEYPIQLEAYMNFRQFSKLGRTPKTYLHLAHFIRDEAIKGGMKDPIVKMEIWKSVNERTPRLFNDTTLNYAKVPYQSFVAGDWYNDWSPSMDSLEFREEKFIHWTKVIEENNRQEELLQ